MSRDQEVYAHLKERHAKARRISSMMLSMKDKGVTVKRQTSCKSVFHTVRKLKNNVRKFNFQKIQNSEFESFS